LNIFVVDEDPAQAARELPDKLIVKMPLESVQMLAIWYFDVHGKTVQKKDGGDYKIKGHANHPCTRWLYGSEGNVKWLLSHATELCEEYTRRYGKVHACAKPISAILNEVGSEGFENHDQFALALPEKYKTDDAISSYRDYLMSEKGYAEWNKGTPPPGWWDHEKHRPVREKYLAEKKLKATMRRNAASQKSEKLPRSL
jgi:hypothetical protein